MTHEQTVVAVLRACDVEQPIIMVQIIEGDVLMVPEEVAADVGASWRSMPILAITAPEYGGTVLVELSMN